MSIEDRLRKLEAAQKAHPGAIILYFGEDGTTIYHDPDGKEHTCSSETTALKEIHAKYGDDVVIIAWKRSDPEPGEEVTE